MLIQRLSDVLVKLRKSASDDTFFYLPEAISVIKEFKTGHIIEHENGFYFLSKELDYYQVFPQYIKSRTQALLFIKDITWFYTAGTLTGYTSRVNEEAKREVENNG